MATPATSQGFSLLVNSDKVKSEESIPKMEMIDDDSVPFDDDAEPAEPDQDKKEEGNDSASDSFGFMNTNPKLFDGAKEATMRHSQQPPRPPLHNFGGGGFGGGAIRPPEISKVANQSGHGGQSGGHIDDDAESVLSSESDNSDGIHDEADRRALMEIEEEKRKREHMIAATKTAKIPDYRQVQQAVEERMMGMTDRDKQVRKLDLLRRFKDLRNRGYTDITPYNMSSDLEDMEIEYEYMSMTQRRKNGVKLYSNFMMNMVTGIEFLNENYNPFEVKLSGWSDEIGSNLDDFEDVLGDIFEKYKGNGKQMEPEMKLAFMLFGSAATFHAKNTLFGKFGIDQPRDRDQPRERDQRERSHQPPPPVLDETNEEFRETFPVQKSEQIKGVERDQMLKTIQAAKARALAEQEKANQSVPSQSTSPPRSAPPQKTTPLRAPPPQKTAPPQNAPPPQKTAPPPMSYPTQVPQQSRPNIQQPVRRPEPPMSTQTPISIQTPTRVPSVVNSNQRPMVPPPIMLPRPQRSPMSEPNDVTETTFSPYSPTSPRSPTVVESAIDSVQNVSDTMRPGGSKGDTYATTSSVRKRSAQKKQPATVLQM